MNKMPYTRLHASGPEISRIVQGFGGIPRKEKHDANTLAAYLDACLDAGITAFDTAAVYGGGASECALGEVFARRPDMRGRVTVITKYGIEGGGPGYHCYNTSKDAIVKSAERSLWRMNIECIDILLMHRPDMLMDADEVAAALTKLKDDGKVLHFGVSNFLPFQYELLQSRLAFPLITNEIPYSLFDMGMQENGVLDQCQRLRIAPLYYSPLGGGRLFKPASADDQRLHNVLNDIAAEHGGVPIEQIAIAWILKHPAGGAAIIGSSKTERMRDAAGGASISLSRDQWFRLWTAAKGHEIP